MSFPKKNRPTGRFRVKAVCQMSGYRFRVATKLENETETVATVVDVRQGRGARVHDHDKSASRALVKFTMSDSVPSARLSRNMFGRFGSPTMRGSSLGALRLSVTFCSFCLSATPIDAV